jgi:two-component system osmolarity sensor histidine kinase EnvZ
VLALHPSSLFTRVLVTLVITFGLFALLTFGSVVYFALVPVAERSTRDLAAFMVLSARTVVQLPEELRPEYRSRLESDYGLRLREEGQVSDALEHYFFPYARRLQEALERRLGAPVELRSDRFEGERWFWARVPAGNRAIWVGFPRGRVQSRPLEAALVVLAAAIVLVLVTATILARRVTGPLERLAGAAEQVARGGSPSPLPETGPRELANLARQFNEMSRQVQELLANRTLLLAGISHDLRTPLTRLRLALELLPEEADAELVDRMERDLGEMNALIRQAVELGQTLGAGERHAVDLGKVLADLAAGRPRIDFRSGEPCLHRVNELALRRIVGNLLENALRYSTARVELNLDCRHRPPVIFVIDRGPGIPEAEREAVFRPFYRLEQSRNRRTGGSGLGLAVARQLAIANGIEIHLGPRRGGGTVATVTLPPAVGAEGVKPEPKSG